MLSSIFISQPTGATTDAPSVDCSIENLTPEIQVGAQATYVVHLSGGFGSYSLGFAYGDGRTESRSVNGYQTTMTYWFSYPGTFTQTASVSGAGSSATCTSSTNVYP